jgi:hypothetical protein
MMSSGTRVNWRKGFFRVWVLGAVLWMPLSALVVADSLVQANRREAETKFLADFAARPAPAPDKWWEADPLASDVDAAAEAGAALDASDYSQVAAVAFLPRLVVLIAGFALGWVYRGFRAS